MTQPAGYISRSEYFDRIKTAAAESAVTVLSGVRRCGKTFLLKELIADLKTGGVDDGHIIYLDLERFVFPKAAAQKELKQYLAECLHDAEKYYIFLDEAQAVAGWERVLSAFIPHKNVSVFVTVSGAAPAGKNGKKNIAGKWQKIMMTPLSYAEYRCAGSTEKTGGYSGLLQRAITIKQTAIRVFDDYVRKGGFPATAGADTCNCQSTLSDIYSAILYHDVITRYNIKNVRIPEMIIKYIFEHIGEECSAGKIAAFFKQKNYKKNISTISNIMRFLETASVIIRIRLINLVTMKIQNAHSKYFPADHALFQAVSGSDYVCGSASSGILANIVVSELRRRGYEVYTGKADIHLVDFAALNNDNLLCIQTLFDADISVEALEEKYAALEYAGQVFSGSQTVRKFIIFSGTVPFADDSDDSEIRGISLPDFLMSREY